MNENKHVYCTRCKHFRVIEKGKDDFYPDCDYKDKCDIWDCEDSTPFKNRPCYEERDD